MILFATGNIEFYYIGAAVLVALLLSVLVLLISINHKKRKAEIEVLDETFLLDLTSALGGYENIVEVSREHMRLKVKLIDLKKIQAPLLEKLKLGAFLKGKEVTLLIKKHTEMVEKHLNANRKGA